MTTLDFSELLARYRAGDRRFQGVNIEHADAFECDLRDIDLVAAIIDNAYLPYGNLSRANLQELVVKQGNLGDAKLPNSNLNRARLNGVNLSRADLRYCRLRETRLSGCNLSGADLTGADLTGADLTEADLTGADLTEADLSDACLIGATFFRAVNLDVSNAKCDRTTILPDGHYYP
ncbi:pentapeptide repeat-containing protein [Leptolyngbya iicbica]|uniref:Pentapeptide repeat-containing protein n=2 Tax=Cyanophyceae TaxID=3028117 RepID=A0A4Q7E733_9CYAN|nr:pentapeptide repeat-containing protein [Leptolyngbya sp. LK]RZM78960.1 pentapeptide repeat-containing protein [Leptolyngbya sp. LK]